MNIGTIHLDKKYYKPYLKIPSNKDEYVHKYRSYYRQTDEQNIEYMLID